jgi:aspartate ammonia-lyase
MNVNEVLANRALQLLGEPPGTYTRVSPADDVNLHQSTNDTFPTALRLASIVLLHDLEEEVVSLQEAFQQKEQQFAHVVKVGRTQYQDAILTTLGREMGAYAEALNRDRWRIYKCEERLRVVNLGGTAIGTGFAAPRQYIFRVVDALRELTSIGFARAENLTEATQNADVFVEVSGILKAHAMNLFKICGDLRLMSSGPEAGLSEIRLPQRQAGSSIMPGKVNPVIPEAVTQAALMVAGYDATIATAVGLGSLELNAFLPLVAACLLQSLALLARSCEILRRHCIEGLEADEERCAAHVHASSAAATALVPEIGYDAACALVREAKSSGSTIREIAVTKGLLTDGQYEELLAPEAVCRLGHPQPLGHPVED